MPIQYTHIVARTHKYDFAHAFFWAAKTIQARTNACIFMQHYILFLTIFQFHSKIRVVVTDYSTNRVGENRDMETARFSSLSSSVGLTKVTIVLGLLALQLACVSHHVIAQTVLATLSGTVTDPSGAALAGASVVAEEVATGTKRSTLTNQDGIFSIPLLQPGTYNVTVSEKGFSTTSRPGIELQVNQRASIAIVMKVGSLAETVQVSGEAPLLDTQTVELGSVIGSQEILDLPMNGRQFSQLLQLVPGTVPIDISQNAANNPIGSGAWFLPLTVEAIAATSTSSMVFMQPTRFIAATR